MGPQKEAKPWLSDVIELAKSFQPVNPININGHNGERVRTTSTGLGDFSALWTFLGTASEGQENPTGSKASLSSQETFIEPNSPPSSQESSAESASQSSPEDGGVSLIGFEGLIAPSIKSPDVASLTKTQKKKLRRREQAAEELSSLKNATDRCLKESSLIEYASDGAIYAKPVSRQRPEAAVETPSESLTKTQRKKQRRKARAAKKAALKPETLSEAEGDQTSKKAPARLASAHIIASHIQPPIQHEGDNTTGKAIITPEMIDLATSRVAQSVAALKKEAPPAQPTPQKAAKTVKLPRLLPNVEANNPEARHWDLFMKIVQTFPEDRKHIVAPMNLTNHNTEPSGIHVFVDASNIFIGFSEHLRRSRGLFMPPVRFSFDALALLMERRRPIAKRVLVGSTPHMHPFDKARDVGYECSILEKVEKVKLPTEREIYFRDLKRQKGKTIDDTKARRIEQGVDEILQLKILESLVDTVPSTTIVLATGDGAQSEFSPGFMVQVVRALEKGWKVELVTWSSAVSGIYKKKNLEVRYAGRFRIVYLDDFVEELLDL